MSILDGLGANGMGNKGTELGKLVGAGCVRNVRDMAAY
jgi:hypothetical protein